jgi:hypothetical protein
MITGAYGDGEEQLRRGHLPEDKGIVRIVEIKKGVYLIDGREPARYYVLHDALTRMTDRSSYCRRQ